MQVDGKVERHYDVGLDPALNEGNIQGLIDALTAIRDRPVNGPTVVVETISGGTYRFRLTVVKPD